MSNIDKQACQVSRYDLVSGYMQKWPDGEFVYHSDYQALLDELEAAEKRIAELQAMLARLYAECDTGERRGNGSQSGVAMPSWVTVEAARLLLGVK
ncbi:hypothetical protein [Enterobacter roggenkampii]|uniref:hypothetical protein n=1 Tax=Enterobacter roggenkampii TaxID=1812935 RepID=UPI0018AC60A2|nr:hypothetical protein [Enterobacter roggenkampii]